jgi:hypothetical protein
VYLWYFPIQKLGMLCPVFAMEHYLNFMQNRVSMLLWESVQCTMQFCHVKDLILTRNHACRLCFVHPSSNIDKRFWMPICLFSKLIKLQNLAQISVDSAFHAFLSYYINVSL